MSESIVRVSGVRVSMPSGVRLADAATEADGFRGFDFSQPIALDDAPDGLHDPMWADLRAALASSGMHMMDTLDLVPDVGGPALRGADNAVQIDVPVGADEDAVVLLDEGGVLTWVMPLRDHDGPGGDGSRDSASLRGGAGGIRRFAIVPTDDADAGEHTDGTRSWKWLSDWAGKRVKAIIMRYGGEALLGLAADAIVGALESKQIEGPVVIQSPNPLEWNRVASLAQEVTRPIGRALLLVHGTFSSTMGSFGALGVVDSASTLRSWLGEYDLVVGFDHHTLSKTPSENAGEIWQQLEAMAWQPGARVDVVCFSRGGLVARTLVEHILPAQPAPFAVERVICVATTNAGTLLARPENWKHFVDLMTNLSMAACRLLDLAGPQGVVASRILGGVIDGLAILIKALSATALEGSHVPGLAAMNPDGDVVADLNSGPAPALSPATRYFAITSNFEPRGDKPDDFQAGLPGRVARWAADQLVDRLFGGENNDLVVHNASTTTLHPAIADRLVQVIHQDSSADVYHLSFFHALRTSQTIASLLSERAAAVGSDRGLPCPSVGDFSAVSVDAPLLSRGDVADERGGDAPEVDLFGEASSQGAVEVGRKLIVDVTLQREAFAGQPLPGAARAHAEAKPGQPLVVDILPRGGLAVVGDSVQFVDLPSKNAPAQLFFVLQGVEATDSPAEVFVNVRQGHSRLMQMELRVRVVPVGAPLDSSAARVTGATPAERTRPADAQLRVRYQRTAGGYSLDYELDAWALQIREGYPPMANLSDRFREEIEGYFSRIDALWKADKTRPDAFAASLRGVGRNLAKWLLPDSLRASLWTHREGLAGFELESDEPFIPWELAYIEAPDGSDGYFLAELGFTRAMRGAFCPDQLRVRTGHCYSVTPRYPDKLHLDFAVDEEQWLARELHAMPVALPAPDRTRDFRSLLSDGSSVDLLHYAGHGDADEFEVYLVLSGDVKDRVFHPQRMASSAAEPHFARSDGTRPLVFLNACKAGVRVSVARGETSWARTFLHRGQAGAFVAPLWSVGDRSAGTFARAFYDALRHGSTFAEATRAARKAAREAGDPTWASYSVFASPHGRVEFQAHA